MAVPQFNRRSYVEVKSAIPIAYIDLTLATERHDGLILYSDNKSTQLYFIISLQNKLINITYAFEKPSNKECLLVFSSIRLDHFVSSIQFSDTIDLNTYVRLQVRILYNEVQAKLNNGNILSSMWNRDFIDIFYFVHSRIVTI